MDLFCLLYTSNYEDLMKNLTENERSNLLAEIDNRLEAWVADTGGKMCIRDSRVTALCQRGHVRDGPPLQRCPALGKEPGVSEDSPSDHGHVRPGIF